MGRGAVMGDAHRFRYYVRPNLPLFPPVFVFAWGVLAADPLLALDRASADWVTAGRCARAPPTASAFSTGKVRFTCSKAHWLSSISAGRWKYLCGASTGLEQKSKLCPYA